jgi:hypothetical protein
MLFNLKKMSPTKNGLDVAKPRADSTDSANYKAAKPARHESTQKSKNKSRKKRKHGPTTMRRMKEVRILTNQRVSSTVQDDDNHYPDTSDTEDDSDDSSLQAIIKENGIDNQSEVHTIHVIRRRPEHGREPRLVAIKKLERLGCGLDTDEANIIFQPERTPWKLISITPHSRHDAADSTKETSVKKRFRFLRKKSREEHISEPIGYVTEEEDECKTVPLRIIHTESNDDSAFFFYHFATTRAWAQLRTLLKVISVPELRETIKAVEQLRAVKAKEQNALHLLCMNDPPFDIVARVSRISPNLPTHKDIYGQFPLHTVLAHGVTSWSVVEMLVNHNIYATDTCDNIGMTPLMLACCDMIPDDEGIIFALLAVCPYVINVENENEMSAIDFARLSNCCSNEMMGYLTLTSDEEIMMSEEESEEGSQ